MFVIALITHLHKHILKIARNEVTLKICGHPSRAMPGLKHTVIMMMVDGGQSVSTTTVMITESPSLFP